jgi:hypothetical protein
MAKEPDDLFSEDPAFKEFEKATRSTGRHCFKPFWPMPKSMSLMMGC